MKKVLSFVVVLFICFISVTTIAKADSEPYFINNNGIEMTQKEYDLFLEMYDMNEVLNMTLEKYQYLSAMDINNREIETVVYEDRFNEIANPGMSLYATWVETTYKKLAISKGCDSAGYCSITLALQWKVQPATRSYDHIGVRYNGMLRVTSSILTYVQYDSYGMYCSNYKIRDNGHGCAFDLSDTANIQNVTQMFTVNNYGTIYGSYQHATSNITSTNANKYSISYNGYGRVFYFYDEAFGVYDGMSGVNIDI